MKYFTSSRLTTVFTTLVCLTLLACGGPTEPGPDPAGIPVFSDPSETYSVDQGESFAIQLPIGGLIGQSWTLISLGDVTLVRLLDITYDHAPCCDQIGDVQYKFVANADGLGGSADIVFKDNDDMTVTFTIQVLTFIVQVAAE